MGLAINTFCPITLFFGYPESSAGGQKCCTAYIIRKHKMVQYGTGQTDYKGE